MQLWPPVMDPAKLTRQVWDANTARTIPGVGRALQLYGGLISQCALDLYRGDEILNPRPRFLSIPDVSLRARSTYVRVQVEDYLLHGNALHVVTMRDSGGKVQGTKWFPAWMWHMADPSTTRDGGPDYYLNGISVPRDDVVHVQRGAAPGQPWRGVGVVEEHIKTLNRAGLEEAAESENLSGGGVPSIAVIAPDPNLDKDDAVKAADDWQERFAGPGRRPAVLPNGTQVIPLGWDPQQGEMVAARQMTLVDIANGFNLEPYWLGAPGSSHTYKSPGPMFLQLLRTSLNPVMVDFEQVWSLLWMPQAGRTVKFDRLELTRDDFSTEVTTGAAAVGARLMTREEWRIRWGMPIEPQFGSLEPPPAPAPPQPEPDPTDPTDPTDPEES